MKTFIKECRWGSFLLLRGDMISTFADIYGEWSEMEIRLFQRLLTPQSNVVEIGSNLGLHTVALSKIAHKGKIICFEPQRIIFQMLCGNIAINNLLNVFPHRAGVSDEDGTISIQSCSYDLSWNYGSFSLDKGLSTEGKFSEPVMMESVRRIALDAFTPIADLPSLDLLKVDAEQHEIACLKGATATIEKHKPIIFVENNNETHGDALIAFVKNLGYSPFWFCSSRFQADNFNRVPIQIPGADLNMICFPSGRDPLPGLIRAERFSQMQDQKTFQSIFWRPT
jgi:FkbM family methyltransferase